MRQAGLIVSREPVQFHEVTPEISVIIPLRDEELNVVPLHAELTSVLRSLGVPYEIIMVDDGSVDATFAKLSEVQHNDPVVSAIRFQRNFGQTAAFAAGFARARGRLIVTLDGDLQNDPADIPRMLDLAKSHDVVVGWRKHRQDSFLTRELPSVVANWLIGIVTGVRLHDNGCSLKVFRADVVKPLKLRHGMHRYLPALASQLGPRVTEVVVKHRARRHGHSKYGLSRTFRVIGDLVALPRLMREALDDDAAREPLYEIREVLC
jgi:glycosyltransferase involved in cell wall biosynthesis